MKNSATIESLKAMRFSAMAAELERQIQNPSIYAHMGFEERVALLVDAEWNSRQNNKLIRCVRDARFAEPSAAVEDIEYYEDRHLDKAQLLRFATCDFIAKGHHIIFKGASGNGKTYIACAMESSLPEVTGHQVHLVVPRQAKRRASQAGDPGVVLG